MLKKQDATISAHIATGRAIDELRRQMGVMIQQDNTHFAAVYPAEFLTSERLEVLTSPPHSGLKLLLTAARAHAVGMATETAVAIDAGALSVSDIMALSDPLAQGAARAPLHFSPASVPEQNTLRLAKFASLLPALMIAEGDGALANDPATAQWAVLTAEELAHYIASPLVDVLPTAHASLPLEGAEHTEIISFRSAYSTAVHLALVFGDISTGSPLTRIHSSCVTGDILGSLRCDCGDQLKLALSALIESGSGILVYLHQEGRGIGLTNKLRAYQLQEQGMDTYEANLMLGFDEDERDFSLAAAILRKLGVSSIRMLTNNPHKMSALQHAGITVTERMPLVTPSGKHNHAYLDAKAKKSGHIL